MVWIQGANNDDFPGTNAPEVIAEVRGKLGMITLNRPKALNALSLGMVRDLLGTLLAWQKDDSILGVAIRGSNKEGCSGHSVRVAISVFCMQQAAPETRNSKTSSRKNMRSTI
ncbi:enoyl-CoA hydratase/isomerase family protein [Staphylococcus epidermidis]|nr:enoyl-CoA hydratase/isomerase family protein [Staphylococcus epidermidis]